jgi:hypothetical protein
VLLRRRLCGDTLIGARPISHPSVICTTGWCRNELRRHDRGAGDETLIRFSLRAARRQAWAVAGRLGPLVGQARAAAIVDCDRTAAAVGRRAAHPGIWASAILLLVRGRERARPADVIALLAAVRPAAP